MKRPVVCALSGLLVAGFLPLCAPAAATVDDLAFTRRGGWTEGWCAGMVIDHPLVYLANGAWLEAVDVSDPASPRVRSRVELSAGILDFERAPAAICALTADNVLHVVRDCGGGKLQIEGRVAFKPALDAPPDELAVVGPYVYVSDHRRVHIVDVARPGQPRVVRSLANPFGPVPLQAMAVIGNTLYLGQDGSTHILDVSDPLRPVPVRELVHVWEEEYPVDGEFLEINDGLLNTSGAGTWTMWELDDPRQPRRWNGLSAEQPVTGFAARDSLLFVAQGELALYTRGGRLLSQNLMQAWNLSNLEFVGERLFACQEGLTILDLPDPFTPTVVGRRQTGVVLSDLRFDGGRVFLAGVGGRLTVLDGADPDRPVPLGTWSAPTFYGWVVSVNGQRALLGGWDGSWVVDVSDPAAMRAITPREIRSHVIWAVPAAGDWFVSGGSGPQRLSVAADGSAAFTPVDLPEDPCEVRPGVYVGCRGSGDRTPGVWLAEGGGDPLRVADLEVPDGYWFSSFAASGDIVWSLACTPGVFEMAVAAYDLSAPRQPRSLGQSVLPTELRTAMILGPWPQLTADGSLLYLWNNWCGEVVALDARDPRNVVQCGGLWIGNGIVDVTITGDRLVVATATGGYRTYERPVLAAARVANVPESPSGLALRAAPNPFNPSTSVTFTLASTGQVEIGVYDLCGRRVCGLHAGVLTAGAHTFTWRGTDEAGRPVAAGAYVARANRAGETTTVKLLLAK